MSLNQFITHVKQIGFVSGSKFELVAPMIDSTSNTAASTVSMLCNSAVVPGHTLMTNELRYFGEATERPYGVFYTPVALTFYLDNDLSAKRYFDQWVGLVFNKDTRELGYYDSYTRDIEIVVYNKNEEEIDRIKLYEAYPKAVNDFPLDYSQTGVAVLTVQLVYKWWTSSTKDTWKGGTGGSEVPTNEIPAYGLGGQQPEVESLGNQTFKTYDGSGGDVNPTTEFQGFNANTAFQQAGTNIHTDSTRALTQASNLFGISSVESAQYPQLGSLLSENSSTMMGDFGGFANGLTSLGSNLDTPSSATPQIAGSLSDMAVSLASLGNMMGSMGAETSEFLTISNNISQTANYIQTTTESPQLAGHFYSVASNMSAAGSLINNSLATIQSHPSYDRTSEIAFKNTASTFLNTGSILNSATNFLTEK
jgi:hypothetical protein